MKRILTLFVFLPCLNIFAQVWGTQNSGVNTTLLSVCFIDTLNGWAVGDSSIILKTSDGGKNWLKQTCPIKSIKLRTVQFISKDVGFIAGFTGSFLSTNDGGVNWSTGYIMPDSSGFYYDDLCFIDENEGWVPARKIGYNYGIGLILHTTNGGKTWEKQLEIDSSNPFSAVFFSAVKFQDNKVGWALGGDSIDNLSDTYIYKTLNGGSTWVKIGQISSIPNGILRIANKDTLWTGETTLATSFDGGNNWNYFPMPLGALNDALQISPESGLVGWKYYFDLNTLENSILYTNNAGQTWKTELKWSGSGVYSITNIKGYAWIVGTKGLIMRRNPLITSVKKEQNELPKEFRLYPNYPNPFNPVTKISFALPNRSNVKLVVYDILGREIATLANSVFEAGSYSIPFDASKLSSGIYIYTIHANDFVQSKKMILVK